MTKKIFYRLKFIFQHPLAKRYDELPRYFPFPIRDQFRIRHRHRHRCHVQGIVGSGDYITEESFFSGLGGLLLLIDRPVKYVVIPESFAYKEITEDLSEIRVVGLLIEPKRAAIVEIDGELFRDRKSTRLNSSHQCLSRMPSSA